LQEAESACENAKRAEREKDVLLAEKHVWTMAHSGVQAELVKNLSALEKEKQVPPPKLPGRGLRGGNSACVRSLRKGWVLTAPMSIWVCTCVLADARGYADGTSQGQG
jgi:hypothetical protein